MPRGRFKNQRREDEGAYLPTAEEIAEAAAEIRAGWSKQREESSWQGPGRVPVSFEPAKTRNARVDRRRYDN